MNENYKSLELHKVLEMLEKEASNERTKQMIAELDPNSDFETVKTEMQKTADALELSIKFGTPSFVNFKDVTGSLKRAQAGASLSLRELLDIAKLLGQIHSLCDWRDDCEGAEDSLSYLFTTLTPNKYLLDKITMSVISEDEISDGASAELAAIRKKIIRAEAGIRDHLDKMLKNQNVQKCLQETLVTLRDGRFVLPVKAENKSSVQGLVHDTSASGATLFIEPLAVVEANNDIRILKIREKEEIERIIAALSAECASFAEPLMNDYETCAEINFYFAKANLGARMRGGAPEITDDGRLYLKNARHPLIDPKKVVPVTIGIGDEYKALIITGPNTGGKTVSLKTAGLLTAMTMCGLLIPVSDGSTVSVYKQILVNIGDQQSIEMSLSTFSSHMTKVREILETADEDSLVILDELGSGTDPVEGAALGVAIIEKLLFYGCKIFATTHYQELKLSVLEIADVQYARCEFDVEKMQPTYKLIVGSPGKSNAFAISSGLGIADDVIKRAESLVSSENKRFEQAVEQLEAARHELEAKSEEVSALRSEAKQLKDKLEKETDEFSRKKNDMLEDARLKASRIVESVTRQSDEIISELDKVRKEKDKQEFSQRVAEVKSMTKSTVNKMYKEANPVIHTEENYTPPRPFRRGDTVMLADTKQKGIIASDPDSTGYVFVQAGIMKTKVKLSMLRLVDKPDDVKKTTGKGRGYGSGGIQSKIQRKVQLEIDLRGFTVDDAILDLGAFIDNAVLSGVGMVTIIHGKGTGMLRNGVHKYLKKNLSVKSFRLGVYGEGEDGVTIVELQ